MDQAERKDTAQHALVYVGIAVAVAVALVLLWYAIDVVLLAFIGVLFAILLRAPADWLSERFGWSEGRSLALVAGVLLVLLAVGAVFFGRGIAVQALALIDRIPEIVQGFKDQLSQSELGARVVAQLNDLVEGIRTLGGNLQRLRAAEPYNPDTAFTGGSGDRADCILWSTAQHGSSRSF